MWRGYEFHSFENKMTSLEAQTTLYEVLPESPPHGDTLAVQLNHLKIEQDISTQSRILASHHYDLFDELAILEESRIITCKIKSS